MATNATMTIRIDADLKRQAEAICEPYDVGGCYYLYETLG